MIAVNSLTCNIGVLGSLNITALTLSSAGSAFGNGYTGTMTGLLARFATLQGFSCPTQSLLTPSQTEDYQSQGVACS